MSNELYIGLMSGTSLDGVDAALVDFGQPQPELIATHCESISKELKTELLALCKPGNNAIQRMGEADVKLGHLFADTVLTLLKKASMTPEAIKAIGSHGQTIRHRPEGAFPFTLQIGDPNIIAAKTHITTVADFRRRDIALGGEGAPLAPAFHNALLRSTKENRLVLNIGGIANLTYLPQETQKPVTGFDTGPGNTLLDAWCMQEKQMPYDKNGEWGLSGKVNLELLALLLDDPYFHKAPPKSTGRETFHLHWLENNINQLSIRPSPEDVQATLLELTAQTISNSINLSSGSVWLCGGGARNIALVECLKQHQAHLRFTSTEEAGIHADWLEAVAFAWLAQQRMNDLPGNLPSVTGARDSAILGAVYSK